MGSKQQTSSLFLKVSVATAIICGILIFVFFIQQYQVEKSRINKHTLTLLKQVKNANRAYMQDAIKQIGSINSKSNFKDSNLNLHYGVYNSAGIKTNKIYPLGKPYKPSTKINPSYLSNIENSPLIPTIKNNFSNILWIPACQASDKEIICLFKDASFINDLLKHQQSYEKTQIQLIRSDGVIVFDSANDSLKPNDKTQNIELSKKLKLIAQKKNGQFNSEIDFLPKGHLGHINWDKEFGLFTLVSTPNSYIFKHLTMLITTAFALFLVSLVFLIWSTRQHKKTNQSYLDVCSEIEKLKIQNQDTVALVTENMPGIIYRVLLSHEVLFVSQNSFDFLGIDAGDIYKHGTNAMDFIHQEDKARYEREVNKYAKSLSKFEMTYRIVTANNETKWVIDRGRFFQSKQNQTVMEGMLFDITEHMASQKKIEYLAKFDPLTNLKNRFMFSEEMLSTLAASSQKEWALIFIDLDRFKDINDSLGHQVGDKLLKITADRLRTALGSESLIARMGADEFIALIKAPSGRKNIEELALKVINQIAEQYHIDYYKLNTTCSIGISMFPEDTDEGAALLKNADTAMLFAKSDGGNCLRFYNEEMKRQLNLRLTMENELRTAIEEEQFEVFYQPKVCTKTFNLQGAEALIRWRHPERGLVSPFEFIPVAEETGLIVDIGQWIIEESCRQFKAWNDQLAKPLSVSVNLSVKQLNSQLIDKIVAIINKTEISTGSLELEITETLLMNNIDENIKILESLNNFGIDISLDDFGTGYSSLSYLKKLPITSLKIDRSFTMNVAEDADTRAIVETIVAMAKTLKLKTVVEGLENEEQINILEAFDCYTYQGYYFSKPIPAKTFYSNYILPIISNQVEAETS